MLGVRVSVGGHGECRGSGVSVVGECWGQGECRGSGVSVWG